MFRIIIVSFILCFTHLYAKSQTFQRQSLSSAGSQNTSQGTWIRQTVGQPYNTSSTYKGSFSYRPGFQQPILKIQKIQSNLLLDVFPNPTAAVVNIRAEQVLDNVSLTITDYSGKTIHSEKIPSLHTHRFDCSLLNDGIYLITVVTSDNKAYSAKLIINR